MASTTIDTRGTVDSSSGTGLTVSVPATFTYLPGTTVQALTDPSGSVTYPGVYTAGHTAPSGYYLPTPASIPGGVVSFRTTTAQAHWLTSSDATLGKFITDGTGAGSKLTIVGAVGSSVTLISDGKSFCVLAKSGSAISFSGT